MRQIGVYCGTFNPIHVGHLLIAEFAREQFGLEQVLFVTSAAPPHRSSDLLDADCRHQLVEAAIRDNRYFAASRMELDRQGPSYTVDTLRQLKAEQTKQGKQGNDCQLNLLVGEDNVRQLPGWHQADELFSLCRVLVAPRALPEEDEHAEDTHTFIAPARAPETMKEMARDLARRAKLPDHAIMELIEFPHVPVSSTAIRLRLRKGLSVRYMVHQDVHRILTEKRYYL